MNHDKVSSSVEKDTNAMIKEIYDMMLENNKEPPPLEKGLKKFSDSLPYKLFCFAFGVSGIITFLMNSELLSKVFINLFGLFSIDCDEESWRNKTRKTGEIVVYGIIILYIIFFAFIKIMEAQGRKKKESIPSSGMLDASFDTDVQREVVST